MEPGDGGDRHAGLHGLLDQPLLHVEETSLPNHSLLPAPAASVNQPMHVRTRPDAAALPPPARRPDISPLPTS
jgi:hypothetical protein